MYKDPDSREKRWSGGVLILAAIGALALLAALTFLALGIAAMKFFSPTGSNVSEEHKYLEHRSFSTGIAEIKLDSPIDSEIAHAVVEKLHEAAADKRIKGVLLEVNSPGGSVVASQEIHDTIKRVKEKIPVVAYMREVAASGAYYSAAPSSWIIANRGTMVGSIGVIMSSVEATQLIEWLKLKPVTLKTGRLKDTGSPMRSWTVEDKAYLQALIDSTRDQFVSDVKTARPKITPESFRHMSDGRVILGTEAVTRHLVDSLGGRSDAIAKTAEIAGLSTGADTPVIPMEEREIRSFLAEVLRGSVSSVATFLAQEFRQQRQSFSVPLLSSPRLNLNSSETPSNP
jgi:protease-4